MFKLRIRSRASRLRFLGVGISTFEVRAMRLDDLICPVDTVPVFADDVMKSIEQEGLANPVIVVRGPREDLLAELQRSNGSTSMLADRPVLNVVFGGTNRVAAAKKLDYTHIDCVLLPSFELALRVQEMQRGGYNGTTASEVGTT